MVERLAEVRGRAQQEKLSQRVRRIKDNPKHSEHNSITKTPKNRAVHFEPSFFSFVVYQ